MADQENTIIYVEGDNKAEADFMSSNFLNKEVRNRAYINTLGAELIMKYLKNEGIDVENLHNIHSIKRVLEIVDIADIMLPKIYIDVRVVFDENQIFIPKQHFALGIVPDVYAVLKLSEDLESTEFLGFFEPKKINFANENNDYYFIPKKDLSPADSFGVFVKNYGSNTYHYNSKDNLVENEILRARQLSISLADHDLTKSEIKEFLNFLVKSDKLRDSVLEYDNFETLSYKVAPFLKDQEPKKYKDKIEASKETQKHDVIDLTAADGYFVNMPTPTLNEEDNIESEQTSELNSIDNDEDDQNIEEFNTVNDEQENQDNSDNPNNEENNFYNDKNEEEENTEDTEETDIDNEENLEDIGDDLLGNTDFFEENDIIGENNITEDFSNISEDIATSTIEAAAEMGMAGLSSSLTASDNAIKLAGMAGNTISDILNEQIKHQEENLDKIDTSIINDENLPEIPKFDGIEMNDDLAYDNSRIIEYNNTEEEHDSKQSDDNTLEDINYDSEENLNSENTEYYQEVEDNNELNSEDNSEDNSENDIYLNNEIMETTEETNENDIDSNEEFQGIDELDIDNDLIGQIDENISDFGGIDEENHETESFEQETIENEIEYPAVEEKEENDQFFRDENDENSSAETYKQDEEDIEHAQEDKIEENDLEEFEDSEELGEQIEFNEQIEQDTQQETDEEYLSNIDINENPTEEIQDNEEEYNDRIEENSEDEDPVEFSEEHEEIAEENKDDFTMDENFDTDEDFLPETMDLSKVNTIDASGDNTEIIEEQENDKLFDAVSQKTEVEINQFSNTVIENSRAISNKFPIIGEIHIDINRKKPIEEQQDNLENIFNASSGITNSSGLNNGVRFIRESWQKNPSIGLGIAGFIVVIALIGGLIASKIKPSEQNAPKPISDDNTPQAPINNNENPNALNVDPNNIVSMDNSNVKPISNVKPTGKQQSATSFIEVRKISWEVPDYVSYSPAFKQYFQSSGKSLKSSLTSDLLLATDYVYSDQIRLSVVFDKSGAYKGARVLLSSGSAQVDQIVLQSVNQTLRVLKAPNSVGNDESTTVILKIYF